MAELVPCLVALRGNFNAMFPGRDKQSDGWIGDTAHQQTTSDHNPDSRGLVHAIDVDRDLRGDASMQAVVDLIVRRQKSRADRRLKYVIFNRRIWSASNGWNPRSYTGDNPHDKHAHFSAVSTPSLERNTSSWHLEEVPVALTSADKAWISNEIGRQLRTILNLDVDSSSGVHSLGGALWTAMQRTGEITNHQLPRIEEKLNELNGEAQQPVS